MKMRELIREAGTSTFPAWPPDWTGAVLNRVGNLPTIYDGVLKAVLRPEGRLLPLTMTFDGNDYTGRLAWDGPPLPASVARLLKAHVGHAIRDITQLDVGR